MEKNTKLVIAIVNYNTYRFLRRCLDSIYQGNMPGKDFQIVVVDNASTDGSIDLLKKDYPDVQLIANKKNLGFAKANNQGIVVTRSKYVLLLNPDTLVARETLTRMVSFMEERKDVAIATGKVLLTSGQLDDACHRGFPTPWNAVCQFSGLASIFPASQFFNGYHLGYKNLDKIHEIDSCAGAFMFIRRAVGDKVGWLDEDYFWYGEDLDFCYRVKKLGSKIMFVPTVKIIHHKGVSSGIKKHSVHLSTASDETKMQATKARFEVMRIFYDKHYRRKYPFWLRRLVFWGIRLKESLR